MNREYLIQQRRRIEDQRRTYETKSQSDARLLAAANWETKSSQKLIDQAALKRQFAALRAEGERRLQQRRDALAHLLGSEQQQYMAELASREESVEQRKARLTARAMHLRSERQAREQAHVVAMNEMRFRMSCDPLRELEAKQHALEVAAERAMQMGDRAAQRDLQRQEDLYFQAESEKQLHEAQARDAADVARRAEYDRFVRTELDRQCEELSRRKTKEKDERRQEFEIIRAVWEAEQKDAAERAIVEAKEREEMRHRINASNQARQAQRSVERAKEATLDKDLLAAALAREEAQKQREAAYAAMLRQEAHQYRVFLEQQMVRQASDEAELERLRQEDQERAYRKRAAVWEAEQAAREQLMAEVYAERSRQVAEKEAALHRLKLEKEREAAAQRHVGAEMAIGERMAREAKMKQIGVTREELEHQVAEKQRVKEMTDFMASLERQAAEAAERAYQKRLDMELHKLHEKHAALRPLVRKAQAGERPF